MTDLPAIPDPATARVEQLPALMAGVSTWLDEPDRTLGQVDEMRAQLTAFEEYVAKRHPDHAGPARATARLAEVRVGDLLGLDRRPGRPRKNPAGPQDFGRVDETDRVRFRLMADHRPLVVSLGGVTRQTALDAIDEARRSSANAEQAKRRRRQVIDADARSIEPPEGMESVTGDGWTLLAGDAADVLERWPDGSVDLIVTDPPYPADALDRWAMLGELAGRLLVPQGVLVALTGQILLPDVLDRLRASGLAYGWTYCEVLAGANSRIMARHVLQSWKPWLAFSRGPWPSGRIDWHEDVLPGSRRDKGLYAWQQAADPAAYLIERLSPNGGVVLDPFTGSGTYGLAALEAGRRFVGVEADAKRFDLATDRLREAVA